MSLQNGQNEFQCPNSVKFNCYHRPSPEHRTCIEGGHDVLDLSLDSLTAPSSDNTHSKSSCVQEGRKEERREGRRKPKGEERSVATYTHKK